MAELSFDEVYLFIEAAMDNEREEWRRTRMVTWAALQAGSTKKIKPESLWRIDEEEKPIPRSKISLEEHKALVEKYNRIKNKENGRGQIQVKHINNSEA